MRSLKARLRRFLRASDGATAIEFAIIVPVFMMFCIGIFEGGRMLWIRNSIQTATEEAARWAMVNVTATDGQIQAKAADYYDAVGLDTPSFVITHDTVGTMNFVTITGTYSFAYTFAFFDFGAIVLGGKARVPLIS